MMNYIFDLDGTLLDSMGVWDQVDIDFLRDHGLTQPDGYTDALNKMNLVDSAKYTIELFNLNYTPESLIELWQRMAMHAYANEVELKPHALEFLHALKQRGAKIGIATSLRPNLHTLPLSRHGITDLFDAIAHSGEVNVSKGNPDVFLLAAARMGAQPSDCIVFEDILPAIQSAKSAGMLTCAVYDESAKKDWAEMKKIADYAITDFRDAPFVM